MDADGDYESDCVTSIRSFLQVHETSRSPSLCHQDFAPRMLATRKPDNQHSFRLCKTSGDHQLKQLIPTCKQSSRSSVKTAPKFIDHVDFDLARCQLHGRLAILLLSTQRRSTTLNTHCRGSIGQSMDAKKALRGKCCQHLERCVCEGQLSP